MAHAYTPGLKVLHETRVRKERRLPLKGEVTVEKGVKVTPDDVVARTDLPGNVQMVNVANLLNVDPGDVREVMLLREGDPIEKDRMIAETKGLFGLFKSHVESPVDGSIEAISTVTGQVILREMPIPVEIDAYMSGEVVEVIPEEGVMIETNAAFIQGIFGIGGESRGELVILSLNRDDGITADQITADLKDKIVVGGSFISLEAYEKAVEHKLAGVIVGGFNYHELEPILGYTLGVAITGTENLVTPLVVTEGFGKIRMGDRTFELLKEMAGRFASINGATQIRAGVIRPEIVIPLSNEEPMEKQQEISESGGIRAGSVVRVIRAPYFGRIGRIVGLPSELRKMESETMVRVAEVEIDNEQFLIPRANLEIVETD
jgi:transcription antitermination factor NusG